ncbi:MAG: hypothetical protein KAS32_01770 [Candidatus Peribacteraceae bacterium]|nr:hypothetical protein [Candidatus Peribacteraceae bacterium]
MSLEDDRRAYHNACNFWGYGNPDDWFTGLKAHPHKESIKCYNAAKAKHVVEEPILCEHKKVVQISRYISRRGLKRKAKCPEHGYEHLSLIVNITSDFSYVGEGIVTCKGELN